MKFENISKKTFIFKGIGKNEIIQLLTRVKFDIRSFERGDVIYSKESPAYEIGFVLSGACEVQHVHLDGVITPLNRLAAGGTFGIISVLNNGQDFPTHIVAKSKAEIAFLDKEDFIHLIRSSPDIALNVAEFLAGRVSFLNEKVSAFSAKSCEEKLTSSILSTAKSLGRLEFPFNRKRTAESISCGRASLYRAMESLKTRGLIDFDNKKIYIKDLNSLERTRK